MQELADGKRVKPIHFRDGDYWQDLADSFNAIAARMDESAARSGSSAGEQRPRTATEETENPDLTPSHATAST